MTGPLLRGGLKVNICTFPGRGRGITERATVTDLGVVWRVRIIGTTRRLWYNEQALMRLNGWVAPPEAVEDKEEIHV